jgi:hypothetical protein
VVIERDSAAVPNELGGFRLSRGIAATVHSTGYPWEGVLKSSSFSLRLCHKLVRLSLVGIALICVTMMGGCVTSSSNGTPISAPTTTSSVSISITDAFVSPFADSPLPTPTRAIAESMVTAVVPDALSKEAAASLVPKTGTGLVVGRVLNATTGTPAAGAWWYLGEVIGPDDNPQVVFDVSRAPVTIANRDGVFYFQDVRPGRYAVVSWTPAGSFMLSEPHSELTLLFSVAAGEVKVLPDLTANVPY